MANEYCRYLSNGVTFVGNDLRYQPCCWVPLSPPVKTVSQLVQYQKDITAKVLRNKERYCQDCIKKESSGFNKSVRQNGFVKIPEESIDGDIVSLSIQIDSTCNAACSICGPHFSSLWQKELKQINILENSKHEFVKLTELLDLSKIQHIKFVGGEPLVNDNHLIILNAIPYPENVVVEYISNGSVFPKDNVLEVWNKFKRISIAFSIDDIDDRFHYIRWPLSWDKVKNNITKFVDLPNISRVTINCTVNPMNILNFNQVESWYNDLQATSNKVGEIKLSPCYGIWGTDATPEKLRVEVIKKYGADHRIVKLLNTQPYVPGKWEALLQNMLELDSKRKLSYQQTFSEILAIVVDAEQK